MTRPKHQGGAPYPAPAAYHQSGRAAIAWPVYCKDLN